MMMITVLIFSIPARKNNDTDSIGDVCDPDNDNDGVLDTMTIASSLLTLIKMIMIWITLGMLVTLMSMVMALQTIQTNAGLHLLSSC